jgi:TatD DNase family protein
MDPLRLADTHCHLCFSDFDNDRLEVIERGRKSGIDRILIPGIDRETSLSAIQLSQHYPEVFAAVGIHPNSDIDRSNTLLSTIKGMAREAKVVAIGEIGLDYCRQQTPKEIQLWLFREQLALAGELELPVVIHNRAASEDLLDIIRLWKRDLVRSHSKLAGHPGVLHSFSANEQFAREAFELGFKIGIAGPVTYRKAHQIQSVVKSTPLEALLLETDAPYQTPHPFRGKRNEPANVRIVAEKIAELKQAPLDVVAKITTASGDQLFDWREIR